MKPIVFIFYYFFFYTLNFKNPFCVIPQSHATSQFCLWILMYRIDCTLSVLTCPAMCRCVSTRHLWWAEKCWEAWGKKNTLISASWLCRTTVWYSTTGIYRSKELCLYKSTLGTRQMECPANVVPSNSFSLFVVEMSVFQAFLSW